MKCDGHDHTGENQAVKLLLESGSDPDMQDMYGYTPLMWASEKGYIEIASILIDSGANIFMKNNKDKSAVILALENNNSRTALIRAAGATINSGEKRNMEVFIWAALNNKAETIRLLIKAGAEE